MTAPLNAPNCGPVRWTLLPHRPPEPAEPLARAWLAARLQAPADALEIQRDERGRPRLGGAFERVDCNWSHSGERLLVAMAADAAVGADLELRRPRPRALELARRYFAADEVQWLQDLAPERREDAFLHLWCAKEAVLKAHGHGLSFGLQRLSFVARDGGLQLVACDPGLGAPAQWQVHIVEPEPGYLAALAWRTADRLDRADRPA